MSLTCHRLHSVAEFVDLLQDSDNDFWVSSLTLMDIDALPEKLRTYRVEESLVSDVFTDCYMMSAADAKVDADALVDAVGLGLRKTKVRVKNMPGVVFAFIDKRGPSALMAERADLTAGDRKLSTEERLRRTTMELHVTTMDILTAELTKSSKLSFWVTAWQGCSGEEAKKKAVAAQMEGQMAIERFKRCLLVDVPDCQLACLQLNSKFGLGQRKQVPRARSASGAVAVFFTSLGRQAQDMATAASPPPKRSRTDQGPASEQKLSSSPLLPFSAAAETPDRVARRPADTASVQTPVKAEKPKAAASSSTDDADSEDLYFRQVTVLDKKLQELLPTLPEDTLNTAFVQKKLEEYMRKPFGRLDKFKLDIARIWRNFVERSRADVLDLD